MQRISSVCQGFAVACVLVYAVVYKNAHLRLEPVSGNVYVDVWADDIVRSSAAFVSFPYCQAGLVAAHIGVGTCLQVARDTVLLEPSHSVVIGVLKKGRTVSVAGGPEEINGRTVIRIQPAGAVDITDMSTCSLGMPVVARRCGFVNEIDLFSFPGGTFIPTFVQVVHQKASCVDGSFDLETCQLDFPTSAEFQREIDEFFVGAIDDYKVQFTHAFQSETIGQRTMSQAEHWGVPVCRPGTGSFPPMCYEHSGGGHDLSSISGLLSLVSLTLDSNNDQTNHAGHIEAYRTSGMKLQVKVHYTNVLPWRSWFGLGPIGYQYTVDVIPAQSVWRSITLHPKDFRSWVPSSELVDLGKHDRLLVWADGLEISAHVTGTLGHLDVVSLALIVASMVPLAWSANIIVRALSSRVDRRSSYETMDLDEGGCRRGALPWLPAGARRTRRSRAAPRCHRSSCGASP